MSKDKEQKEKEQEQLTALDRVGLTCGLFTGLPQIPPIRDVFYRTYSDPLLQKLEQKRREGIKSLQKGIKLPAAKTEKEFVFFKAKMKSVEAEEEKEKSQIVEDLKSEISFKEVVERVGEQVEKKKTSQIVENLEKDTVQLKSDITVEEVVEWGGEQVEKEEKKFEHRQNFNDFKEAVKVEEGPSYKKHYTTGTMISQEHIHMLALHLIHHYGKSEKAEQEFNFVTEESKEGESPLIDDKALKKIYDKVIVCIALEDTNVSPLSPTHKMVDDLHNMLSQNKVEIVKKKEAFKAILKECVKGIKQFKNNYKKYGDGAKNLYTEQELKTFKYDENEIFNLENESFKTKIKDIIRKFNLILDYHNSKVQKCERNEIEDTSGVKLSRNVLEAVENNKTFQTEISKIDKELKTKASRYVYEEEYLKSALKKMKIGDLPIMIPYNANRHHVLVYIEKNPQGAFVVNVLNSRAKRPDTEKGGVDIADTTGKTFAEKELIPNISQWFNAQNVIQVPQMSSKEIQYTACCGSRVALQMARLFYLKEESKTKIIDQDINNLVLEEGAQLEQVSQLNKKRESFYKGMGTALWNSLPHVKEKKTEQSKKEESPTTPQPKEESTEQSKNEEPKYNPQTFLAYCFVAIVLAFTVVGVIKKYGPGVIDLILSEASKLLDKDRGIDV